MTPATKKFKDRTVKGTEGRGDIKVAVTGNSITVYWFCGGSRTFTVEDLKEAIEYVNGLGAKYSMWFNLTDSAKSRYHVRLKDGKLTANDRFGENGFVEWSKLLPELEAAITAAS